MAQLLAGEKIVLSDGSKVQAEEYLTDKVIALYFSAGWCPTCRAFTPKLKKFYEEIKKAGKNFEVVFVSRDRSASDLVEYYRDHHGAWVYLEFGNPKIQKLLEDFKVETIPTCKVINPDGTVVVDDATNEVQGSEDALVLWEEWLSFSVFGSCEDLSNGVHPLTAQGVGRVLNLSPAAVDWLQSLIPCDTDPILVLNYNDSFFNSQWQYFDQRWQTNPTGEEKKAFVRSTLVGLGGISVEAATYLIKFDDWDTLYAARRAMQVAVPWLFHHPNAQIAQRLHIMINPDGTVVVDDATNEVQGSDDALALWVEWASFSVFGSCEDLSNGNVLLTAQQVGMVLDLPPSVVIWLTNLPVTDFDPVLVLDFSHAFLSDPWPNNLTGEQKKAFVIAALVGQGGKSVEDSNNLVHFITFNELNRAQSELRILLPWLFYHPLMSAAMKQELNINQQHTIGTKVVTLFADASGRFMIQPVNFFVW